MFHATLGSGLPLGPWPEGVSQLARNSLDIYLTDITIIHAFLFSWHIPRMEKQFKHQHLLWSRPSSYCVSLNLFLHSSYFSNTREAPMCLDYKLQDRIPIRSVPTEHFKPVLCLLYSYSKWWQIHVSLPHHIVLAILNGFSTYLGYETNQEFYYIDSYILRFWQPICLRWKADVLYWCSMRVSMLIHAWLYFIRMFCYDRFLCHCLNSQLTRCRGQM